MMRRLVAASALVVGLLGSFESMAQEPGWSGPVIARGPQRAAIEATPILERPYRPGHFYGNTVRRRHYRGTALPIPRDIAGGTGALVRGQ